MPIEITNLNFIYQPKTPFEHQALKNINLKIDDGEFVAIIGSAGSGKSTLGQHLNGILKGTSGTVTVDGMKTNGKGVLSSGIVRKVGLVFQYPEHQIFGATVQEELEFGCKNFGFNREKTMKLTKLCREKVGLSEDFLSRSPFNLSGGEKRRVALASVLAMDTKILVLDEPTVGLDIQGRRRIGEIISDLHKEGKTIIWIGHNLREIIALADRIIVMHKGEIVLDGDITTVLSEVDLLKQWGIELPDTFMVAKMLHDRYSYFPYPLHSESDIIDAIVNFKEVQRD